VSTKYAMLSNEFLRDFKAMASKHTIQTAISKDNRGAHDAVHDPRIRRALARDRRMAQDEMVGAPDPEVVAAILEALKEGGIPDAGIVKIMRALDGKWPGCAGDLAEEGEHVNDDFVGEEEADADAPRANFPNQNIRGKGTEAFSQDDDFPDNAGRNIGGPRPFRGMPERGGRMAADAALRAVRRVSVDPYPAMMNGDGGPTMAFDSAAEASYEKMFPGVAARIRLL
jgi:hypothetical protein